MGLPAYRSRKKRTSYVNRIPILERYPLSLENGSFRKEFHMITTLFVIALVVSVLFGMIASTERLLKDRQDYVVIDERMIDHRSRL